MKRPPGWHEEARRLAAAGLRSPRIAAELGVSVTSVLKVIDPRYAARQRVSNNAAARRRYRDDPEYRAARQAAAKRTPATEKDAPDDVFA